MSDERPGGMGLRERKRRAVREALSWTALHLAVERGLENVRVQDIATAAGVSPRTFNNYFSSKEEAMVWLGVERAERIGATLRAAPAGEPLPALLVRVFVEEYSRDDAEPRREEVARFRAVTSHASLRGEFLKSTIAHERAIAEAIAGRTGTHPTRDLYPRVLAAAVSGAARVALDYWLESGTPASLTEVLASAIETAVLGVSARPGPSSDETTPDEGES